VEERSREVVAFRLARLSVWLEGNARSVILDGALIRWFHRTLFSDLYPIAAGLVRGPACPFDMTFGPHAGSPYAECEQHLEALCQDTHARIVMLDAMDAQAVREAALQVAAAHHARYVQIYPFLDGNGRTGRLCVNYFAHRYGLREVRVFRTAMSDYEGAISAFIRRGVLGPLVEYLRISLYPESLES
jgi:Fic family protein